MDDYISRFLAMDHDGVVLTLELVALAALLGLGLWRIHARIGASDDDRQGEQPGFDMRRDGQRLSA
jgi:hypothetical protein